MSTREPFIIQNVVPGTDQTFELSLFNPYPDCQGISLTVTMVTDAVLLIGNSTFSIAVLVTTPK